MMKWSLTLSTWAALVGFENEQRKIHASHQQAYKLNYLKFIILIMLHFDMYQRDKEIKRQSYFNCLRVTVICYRRKQ